MRFQNQAKREANMIVATIKTKANTINKIKLGQAIKSQPATRRGKAIAAKLKTFVEA